MISWEIDAHCLTINHPRVKNLDKSSTYECTYLSNSNLVAESLAKDGLYGLEERSSSFITQGCFHYKNYPITKRAMLRMELGTIMVSLVLSRKKDYEDIICCCCFWTRKTFMHIVSCKIIPEVPY